MLASTGEFRIHHLLEQLDIPFEEEVEFEDLIVGNGHHLRFDFVCYEDDGSIAAIIEFQGRQHYIPIPKFGGRKGLYRQQYCDTQKKQYCLKKGYKLICIPYTEENKITEQYLMDKIYG